MSQTYYALLTAIGEAKIANAAALGTRLQISRMAVGDGNGALPTPTRQQTTLARETYRADLNELKVDPLNESQIIAELVIPETEGGYWLREMGLYDAAGDLIAAANCPPSYKPQMSEGSGRTQIMRMVLVVSSTAAVQLKIDPSVVLATRAYVDAAKVAAIETAAQAITVHMQAEDPHPQYKTEVASKQEAEEGTNNVKRMTPLRMFQALRSAAALATETLRGVLRVGTQGEVEAGTLDGVAVTPLKLLFGADFLMAQNGYISLPKWLKGWTLQWGLASITVVSNGGEATVSLPKAFPNNHFGGFCIFVSAVRINGAFIPFYSPSSLATAGLVFDVVDTTHLTGAKPAFYISLGN